MKIIPSNVAQLHFLHQLKDEVDFWNDVGNVGQPVYVRIEPQYEEDFKKLLRRMNIIFQVEEDGVAEKLSSFFKAHRLSRNNINLENYNFDQYLEFSEVRINIRNLFENHFVYICFFFLLFRSFLCIN